MLRIALPTKEFNIQHVFFSPTTLSNDGRKESFCKFLYSDSICTLSTLYFFADTDESKDQLVEIEKQMLDLYQLTTSGTHLKKPLLRLSRAMEASDKEHRTLCRIVGVVESSTEYWLAVSMDEPKNRDFPPQQEQQSQGKYTIL